MRKLLCVIAPLWMALPFAAPAAGQSPGQSSGTTVLKAARVFTATSERPLAPGMVVVEGDHITQVGQSLTVPPGAQVKVSGQSCRTPCGLTVEVSEISATFTHRGYQPQTISVHVEEGVMSAARFVPNPVHADLRPVLASKRTGKELAAAGANRSASASADVPASSPEPESTAGIGNNTPWNPGDVK